MLLFNKVTPDYNLDLKRGFTAFFFQSSITAKSMPNN